MLRKVLSATLAMVFIVSLCLFVYNQTHAAVTCSASASANSFYSSGSVSPGITDLEWDHSKGQSYKGEATVRAACGGDVEKKENVVIRIRVAERAKSSGTVSSFGSQSETTYELYTVSEGAFVRNWDWASVSKIGYATGEIEGASDTDRAEYHSSGYYN